MALGLTVAELLTTMSSIEFDEWVAYFGLEPFGEERADLRQALTTTAIVNMAQGQTKHPKWSKPADFMPFSEIANTKPAEKQAVDPDELRRKMMSMKSRSSGAHNRVE